MFPFSAGQQITERDKNTLNHLYRDDVAVQQISETYMKNEKNEQILLSMQCAQFFIEGDIPSGIKTAQLAIDKSPDTIEAAKVWDILGVFHLKNRQMPEAEAAFKTALAHPKLKNQYRKQCLNNYAVLMKLQNKDQEALEFKKQADAIKDEI